MVIPALDMKHSIDDYIAKETWIVYQHDQQYFIFTEYEVLLIMLLLFRYRNEMNGILDHLCSHIGWTGPGEPYENGEMNEMTLSSGHRIWN